jgi:hypothetical protein
MHEAVLAEIRQERVVSSRGRRNPRGVKRHVGKYPVKSRCLTLSAQTNFANCIRIIK